jgi:ketosteroid isomerase-like protein
MNGDQGTIADILTGREQERCHCIVVQDFDALREVLSPALIHTHTRGNTDDRDSYLRYAREVVEILDLQRESLRVIEVGRDAAVMHGKQINRARLRGKDGSEVRVEAMVTQVWAREADAQWRMVAFHATPLGAPPPAVPR